MKKCSVHFRNPKSNLVDIIIIAHQGSNLQVMNSIKVFARILKTTYMMVTCCEASPGVILPPPSETHAPLSSSFPVQKIRLEYSQLFVRIHVSSVLWGYMVQKHINQVCEKPCFDSYPFLT